MHFLVRRSSIFITVAFLCIIFYASRLSSLFLGSKTWNSPAIEVGRPVCRHVAVASAVGWHFEIYMGIVGNVEKELSTSACGSVRVYRPESFGLGFEGIVDELGLYHGQYSTIEAFFSDIDHQDEGSPVIDLIFLGTF